jgi:hypothetical protein
MVMQAPPQSLLWLVLPQSLFWLLLMMPWIPLLASKKLMCDERHGDHLEWPPALLVLSLPQCQSSAR